MKRRPNGDQDKVIMKTRDVVQNRNIQNRIRPNRRFIKENWNENRKRQTSIPDRKIGRVIRKER